MIVGHAEPILTLPFRGMDVMGRVEIDLSVEDSSRWVGCKLIADDGVLCCRRQQAREQ